MSNISIRFGKIDDRRSLVDWLLQPGILRWFPMKDLVEVEDSAKTWFSYMRYNAVLSAVYDGVLCGSGILYVQPFQKLAHQCLFAIIVDEKYRNKGVGTALLKELMALAKERFQIELLHLEVYDGNPAISLYERMGFSRYGVHENFLKEGPGEYRDKILMQKKLG